MRLKYLITGSSGIVGHSLIEELLKLETTREIRAYDLVEDVDPFDDSRVLYTQGDINDFPSLSAACQRVDVVFHLAANLDFTEWANKDEMYYVNVAGTDSVVKACKERGVRALVYLSTIEVVSNLESATNFDESTPLPAYLNNTYARTKLQGEEPVLQGNGYGDLHTCVIRGGSIYGERDRLHIGSILQAAIDGKLTFRLGNGKSRNSFVYVGNTSHSMILASQNLLSSDPRAAGKVYYLADDPPLNFFTFAEPYCEHIGHPLPSRWFVFGSDYTIHFTRKSLASTCLDKTIISEAAKRDFGYYPLYSQEEAKERTLRWIDRVSDLFKAK